MNFQDVVDCVRYVTTPTDAQALKYIKAIRREVRTYVRKNNIKSLVLGVSGGLDSACVAALCQERYTGVPLIGLSIPISSSDDHKDQAKWVGETFCTKFEEFDGWNDNTLFNVLEKTDGVASAAGFGDFPKAVLEGNLKARLRMITLYDLARKTDGLVLSTDNISELQMGFWTICGDVGDLSPIQLIGKGFELPVIAKNLGIREDIITQPPSDGLGVTAENTDEAQLGASYAEVDTIMGIYLGTLPVSKKNKRRARKALNTVFKSDSVTAEKVYKVTSRYEATHFKRNGPVVLSREAIGFKGFKGK